MSKEIVKAAIKVKYKIYIGFEHGECFKKLQEDGLSFETEEIEQGFITEDGDFIDRKTAMTIAKEFGQVDFKLDKQTLISEDLHLYWLHTQAKQIADLEQQLELTEKALELACLVISKAMCPNGDWESLKMDFANSYKEQAKEMMKSE